MLGAALGGRVSAQLDLRAGCGLALLGEHEWRGPGTGAACIFSDPPFALEFDAAPDDSCGPWRQARAGRAAVPRFADLRPAQRTEAARRLAAWLCPAARALPPGGHLLFAWHSALLPMALAAVEEAPLLDLRAVVARLTRGLRGGDRPKGEAEMHWAATSPRGTWEPWILCRRPLPRGMTVAACLRAHGTGALTREASGPPPDSLRCGPPGRRERAIGGHPTLKPQALLRRMAAWLRCPASEAGRPALDPFYGSGAHIAALLRVGMPCAGAEIDPTWQAGAEDRVRALAALEFAQEASQ